MGAGLCKRFGSSVLAAAVVFLTAFLTNSAQAQFHSREFGGATVHGVPPSVTSFGFGGSPGFHGVPPSVTSLNFGNLPFRTHPVQFGFGHRRHNFGFATPFYGGYYGGGYYIPYDYPLDVLEPGVDDSMEQDYSPGPTLFDRRGSLRQDSANRAAVEDYRDELNRKQREALDFQQETPASQPAPQQEVTPQPSTVLVFKDGHQIEVVNYALLGATLYDLSDGRARKIALASLDLAATVKENDQRGVDFRLPAGTKSN